jgi:predicted XRE-type DNA-binding protein
LTRTAGDATPFALTTTSCTPLAAPAGTRKFTVHSGESRRQGERQTKVRLAVAINEVLHRRGLSQGKAAELLGINQPKVSALSKYRLEGFSVERLMLVRNRPRARRPGRVFVTAARITSGRRKVSGGFRR